MHEEQTKHNPDQEFCNRCNRGMHIKDWSDGGLCGNCLQVLKMIPKKKKKVIRRRIKRGPLREVVFN